MIKVGVIHHDKWNSLMDKITRRIPFQFNFDKGSTWRHPWSIAASWDSKTKQWLFTIKPGFVNGDQITVDSKIKFCNKRTIDRLKKLDIKTENPELSVEAFLTESPKIEVGTDVGFAYRIVGNGSEPESVSLNDNLDIIAKFEPVPKFFLDLGVENTTTTISGNVDSGLKFTEVPGDKNARRLVAFDIVMFKDRPSAKFQTVKGSILDGYIGRLEVVYNHDGEMKDYPYIRTMAKYMPMPEPDLNVSLEGMVDPEWDVFKISTVYFLSPPGYDVGAPLDDTWSPYPKYDTFWNLAHSPQSIPDPTPIDPIMIRTGLLFGMADFIFASLLAPLNDSISSTLATIKARSLRGSFWSL